MINHHTETTLKTNESKIITNGILE